jgi:autotransporter passenger strand-loop-strand repeat protein
MSAHLDESALEALAHGRNDLVADEDRLHVAGCAQCGAAIEEIRIVSKDLSVALSAEAPELPELESLIQGALAKAPDPAYARPPLKVLAGAGLAGLAAAAVLGLLSLPSATAVVSFVRDAIAVLGGVDRVVTAFVPGGWSLIALLGFFVLAVMAVPFRRLLRPAAAGPSSILGVFTLVVMVVGSSFFFAPNLAFALSFEGEWPSPDEGHLVTLSIEDQPLGDALREAASAAGLGYVSQLPTEERRVSIDVHDAELRVVLETLLGDAPVVARRTSTALVMVPGEEVAPEPPEHHPLTVPVVPDVPPVPDVDDTPPTPPTPDVNLATLPDRETFGGDVHIRPGEQVRHVTSTGGDVEVEGTVFGNVTSMGGDIEVKDGGVVHGELVSMGGDVTVRSGGAAYGEMVTMGGEVEVEDGAIVTGARVTMDRPDVDEAVDEEGSSHEGGFFGWVKKSIESAARHAILFVLGIFLLALAPDRLGALRRTIARKPLRTAAVGLMGVVGTVVLTVILAITLIGIPAAIVLAIVAFLGAYVGLVACASVLGAALPMTGLKDKPIMQLGAGVAILFVVSLVPGIGGLLSAIAGLVGYGALILTRGKAYAPGD